MDANAEFQGSIEDDFRFGSNVAAAHIEVRMGFLRKVFSILTCQLALTTAVSALFLFSESVKGFVQTSPGMLMMNFILTFVVMMALMVKRREAPANMILLFVFTLLESITVGTVVTFYDKSVVLEAFVLTLAISFGLVLYTFQSKRDFSSWGAGLSVALLVLLMGGIMRLFFPYSDALEWCLSVGGALVFSLFIVFDTSLIMHKVSPEEYIMACINLYLDIINLFLHLLRILSKSQKQ
ncbi:hypothetical protein BSL78_18790 [Apostichopus japonicus]|uniref:Transmembrane BAX inhibitor motif-containing protein 4 n=1 Tax=Stichopus japonicus TaxID=307972 RepID=A0A2G8K8K6_STIJA|nr:hypothetical protein BSL78_18790 [Apostichopus japonicus]